MALYFTKGEVAIVTGASSGIGAGVAVRLAQLGVGGLCLTGRNSEALKETQKQCVKQSEGRIETENVVIVVGDITDENVCASIVKETTEKFGRIDILINNAGIFAIGLQDSTPIDQYDQIMNVNVRSVVFLTRLCIPYLRKTKGSIVNNSSFAGIRAKAGAGDYCMSKAALDMFTKCVALELATSGVRVNSVNPGTIITDIFQTAGVMGEDPEKFWEMNAAVHPSGRLGTVEEVAEVIAFLASSRASFMSGNITPIDSGRHVVAP